MKLFFSDDNDRGMDLNLKCNSCHKCPPLRPIKLPCCETLHCRACAWKGILENGKYCWYSSCSGNPKLSYNIAILSTEELIKIQNLKTKGKDSLNNNLKSPEDLHSEIKYKFSCCFCNKVYNNIPAYKSHVLSHFDSEFKSVLNKSSPYQCPECNVSLKTWHTLVRHYAFKEDKFFSVTKSRQEDFPLLVRKYVRRSVPSEDENEVIEQRIQDSSTVPPANKKHGKQKHGAKESQTKTKNMEKSGEKAGKKTVEKLIRSARITKQCEVKVLEKLNVLLKKRKRLRRKSSSDQISLMDVPICDSVALAPLMKSSNSGLSGYRDLISPKKKQKKKKKKNNRKKIGEKVRKTDTPADSEKSISSEDSAQLDFPSPLEIVPDVEAAPIEKPLSDLKPPTYQTEYFENHESVPLPGVKKQENNIHIKIEEVEGEESVNSAKTPAKVSDIKTLDSEQTKLLLGEEISALWKLENSDLKQPYLTEYFEDHESSPPIGIKKEEKEEIKIKKLEEVKTVFGPQTEDFADSLKAEAESEEIIIPQYTKCVCDNPENGCQLHQSFQLEVLAASDTFLLLKVMDGDRLTQGKIVKFLHNPWLKDVFPPTTRLPHSQMCEVFGDHTQPVVLLSVESSATTNMEVGKVCGICQVWVGHKEAQISESEFICEHIRIEDDGSFTITCSTNLHSKLHLLEVKNLNKKLIIKNSITFSNYQGFFKIHCIKASIEYLPQKGEILGTVTTRVEESAREEIRNTVLKESEGKGVENNGNKQPRPAQNLLSLGNGVEMLPKEIGEAAKTQIQNSVQTINEKMLAILEKAKSNQRKNKLAFKVKKSAKASSSNVADVFQGGSDTDSDEEMEGSKQPSKPRLEMISSKPSVIVQTKPAVRKGPEPRRIPTMVSAVTSAAMNSLSLPSLLPAFKACSECYFSSPAEVRLKRCSSCPVYQLKVKDETKLPAKKPQHVRLYQEKKPLVTPGYRVFAKVLTNTAGTLVMPERLDPKYYSRLIPLPYDNGVVVVIDNQSASCLTLRKDQMIGKGCQFMYIKM